MLCVDRDVSRVARDMCRVLSGKYVLCVAKDMPCVCFQGYVPHVDRSIHGVLPRICVIFVAFPILLFLLLKKMAPRGQ